MTDIESRPVTVMHVSAPKFTKPIVHGVKFRDDDTISLSCSGKGEYRRASFRDIDTTDFDVYRTVEICRQCFPDGITATNKKAGS